jgi:hypothetical protein
MLEFDSIKSNDTYLKKYYVRLKEYIELILYEIIKKYDWRSKIFHRKIRKAKKILMLFLMYFVNSKHKLYEIYCKTEMMLYHFFFLSISRICSNRTMILFFHLDKQHIIIVVNNINIRLILWMWYSKMCSKNLKRKVSTIMKKNSRM